MCLSNVIKLQVRKCVAVTQEFKLTNEQQKEFERAMEVICKISIKTMEYFEIPNFIEAKFNISKDRCFFKCEQLKQ